MLPTGVARVGLRQIAARLVQAHARPGGGGPLMCLYLVPHVQVPSHTYKQDWCDWSSLMARILFDHLLALGQLNISVATHCLKAYSTPTSRYCDMNKNKCMHGGL